MKKAAILILLSSVLFSCASIRKTINHGQYEEAISRSLKHVQNGHKVAKNAPLLEEVYNKAYQRDMDQINFWRKEGQAASVLDVYNKMYEIRNRFGWVKPVMPLHLPVQNRDAQFPTISDDDYLKAKQDVCDFYYNNAKNLLAAGGRMNARAAWKNLADLQNLNAAYPADITSMMNQAQEQGVAYVLVKMRLRGIDVVLPETFERDLLNIRVDDLNSQWVTYSTRPNQYANYAYTAYVNITGVNLTPERINTITRTETKQIQDGFDKKDSAGHTYNVPHMKTISAQVSETRMTKAAMVNGSIEYYSNESHSTLTTVPISGNAAFNYGYCNVNGDMNAVCAETKKMLGNQPAPFPSTLQLLSQAAGELKPIVRDVLVKNKNIFQ